MHTWSFRLLRGKFPDLAECPKGMLLETHSVDVLVNVDSILSGHYLADSRTALLLSGSHSARPRLERKDISQRI